MVPLIAWNGKWENGNAFELGFLERGRGWDSRSIGWSWLKPVKSESRLRGRAYLRAAEIRFEQLNPDFVCDDGTLAELFTLPTKTSKRLLSGDNLVLALGEALRRRGRLDALSKLLEGLLEGAARTERRSRLH